MIKLSTAVNGFMMLLTLMSSLELISQNLVSNFSFEDTISCPDNVSQITKCKDWYSCGPTPDYFNACSKGNTGVPENFPGWQEPEFGNAYSGLYVEFSVKDYREVIGHTLKNQLTIGKKYFIGFKVSLSDKSKLASNNLGVLFCTNSRQTTTLPMKAVNYAHVYSADIVDNYEDWTIISGSFIADSNYTYLMISNFFSDSLSKYQLSESPAALNGGSYYYIDDVCISEDSVFCFKTLNNETTLNIENSIHVFPNPFMDVIKISFVELIEVYDFTLYDVNLRQVFFGSFTEDANIDVSELPRGVYYYIIHSHGRRNKSGTLIK